MTSHVAIELRFCSCQRKSISSLHFWRTSFWAITFLVSILFLTALEMYYSTLFWLSQFMLKTVLITLWEFPYNKLFCSFVLPVSKFSFEYFSPPSVSWVARFHGVSHLSEWMDISPDRIWERMPSHFRTSKVTWCNGKYTWQARWVAQQGVEN